MNGLPDAFIDLLAMTHGDLEQLLDLVSSAYELKEMRKFLFDGVTTTSIDPVRAMIGEFRDAYVTRNPNNQDSKIMNTFNRHVDGGVYSAGSFETEMDPNSEFAIQMKTILAQVDTTQLYDDIQSHIRNGLASNTPVSTLLNQCKVMMERIPAIGQ